MSKHRSGRITGFLVAPGRPAEERDLTIRKAVPGEMLDIDPQSPTGYSSVTREYAGRTQGPPDRIVRHPVDVGNGHIQAARRGRVQYMGPIVGHPMEPYVDSSGVAYPSGVVARLPGYARTRVESGESDVGTEIQRQHASALAENVPYVGPRMAAEIAGREMHPVEYGLMGAELLGSVLPAAKPMAKRMGRVFSRTKDTPKPPVRVDLSPRPIADVPSPSRDLLQYEPEELYDLMYPPDELTPAKHWRELHPRLREEEVRDYFDFLRKEEPSFSDLSNEQIHAQLMEGIDFEEALTKDFGVDDFLNIVEESKSPDWVYQDQIRSLLDQNYITPRHWEVINKNLAALPDIDPDLLQTIKDVYYTRTRPYGMDEDIWAELGARLEGRIPAPTMPPTWNAKKAMQNARQRVESLKRQIKEAERYQEIRQRMDDLEAEMDVLVQKMELQDTNPPDISLEEYYKKAKVTDLYHNLYWEKKHKWHDLERMLKENQSNHVTRELLPMVRWQLEEAKKRFRQSQNEYNRMTRQQKRMGEISGARPLEEINRVYLRGANRNRPISEPELPPVHQLPYGRNPRGALRASRPYQEMPGWGPSNWKATAEYPSPGRMEPSGWAHHDVYAVIDQHKPAAMIDDYHPKQIAAIEAAENAGLHIRKLPYGFQGKTYHQVIIADSADRADAIAAVYHRANARYPYTITDDEHREIGRLLGYPEEAINQFIEGRAPAPPPSRPWYKRL